MTWTQQSGSNSWGTPTGQSGSYGTSLSGTASWSEVREGLTWSSATMDWSELTQTWDEL